MFLVGCGTSATAVAANRKPLDHLTGSWLDVSMTSTPTGPSDDMIAEAFKALKAEMESPAFAAVHAAPLPIHCATCPAVTTDPDRWDPEASTGIVYCDRCWDAR